VVGLDVAAHELRLASGETVGYDALVAATGAQPHARPFPRADLPGVQDLRRLEEGVALARAFDAGARIAVVGAGFIGTEVASAARQRGLDVTVVDASTTPLSAAFGDLGSSTLLALHRERGVDLRLGRRVTSVRGAQRVEGLELDDGSLVPADVVVVGIGVRPTTDWLAGCGLDVRHGVPTGATGATPLPDVWAVGDVSAWPAHDTGTPRPVEHWTSAVEQSAVVAGNLLRPAGERRRHEPLPYVWTDHYGIRFQQLGGYRPGDDARLLSGSTEERNFVLAYVRDGRVTGTLTADRPTVLPRLKSALRSGCGPEELAALL
jgi:NADPH-dependent 2,4-dienoyl-CoA reductase/sulfur reductase-like enzyme